MLQASLRSFSMFVFSLLGVCGCSTDPVVGLIFIDGPQLWHRGAIVGSTDAVPVVAHTVDPAVMISGLLEGFHGGETYGPVGGPHGGQGSLILLAREEGWETAVFASPRDSLYAPMSALAQTADMGRIYGPSCTSWQSLLHDFVYWVAGNKAARFAVLQLSIVDVPPRGTGSTYFVSFWRELNAIFENTRGMRQILVFYLPHDAELPGQVRPALMRVMGGEDIHDSLRGLGISSLDVAPSLAHRLNLHLVPDYPGQSLAAWADAQRRIRPLSVCVEGRPMVLGTRWLVWSEEQGDPELPERIRFYDVATGNAQTQTAGIEEQSLLLGHLINHDREVRLQN